MLIYKNGVYYIDSLQETVDAREMITEVLRMKYISAFRRITGMILQMIFPFRCTITRQTTKKTA